MGKDVEKLIGSQIARIRKGRDITQAQLAELIDVTTETISRLERGVSVPSLKTLEKISSALHANLKDFFDFEYTKSLPSNVKNESTKLLAYLSSKKADDIKMSYHILKSVFDQIEKNYSVKK